MIDVASEGAFQDGYKAVFRFGLERDETVGNVAERHLRDWLRSRERNIDGSVLDSWDGNGEITLPNGVHIDVTHYRDERSGSTGIRYKVYDGDSVSGRYLVTMTGLHDPRWRTPQVAFVVGVARDAGTAEEAVCEIAPPRVVKQLLEQRRVYDGQTRLQGRPRAIHASDVDEVVAAISDQERQVTLVLASSPGAATDTMWRSVVERLTQNAVGVTGVFVVNAAAVDLLNNELPDALKTPAGHIRLVAPRVVFDNPDARRHPLFTAEELAGMLDDRGQPSLEALRKFAVEPRNALLGAALPADLRRIHNLLDREERRQKLDREVASELAAQKRLTVDAVDASLQRAQSVPESARFPRRREHHRISGEGTDFWEDFRQRLALWLEIEVGEVTEQTVEHLLPRLDLRIRKDRESLTVQEKFLSQLEEAAAALRVELAEVREENDSLTIQLEAARDTLDDVTGRLERAEAELAVLKWDDPAVALPPGDDQRQRDQEELATLQAKVVEASPAEGAEPDSKRSTAAAAEDDSGDPFNARESVDDALVFLANRLGPIIATRLAPYLGGQPWPVILQQLDRARGRTPTEYSSGDPAAQLRVITVRLGKLGYPFDQVNQRIVSTLGQELRTVRNRWSHHDEFSVMDAFRTYDQIHRLLAELGDTLGAEAAAEMREEIAVLKWRRPEPIGVDAGGGDPAMSAGPQAEPPLNTYEASHAVGTGEMAGEDTELGGPILVRTDGASTPLIGDARPLFEPWETTDREDPTYLDELWRSAAVQKVRAVTDEIVEFEGPIQLDRLVILVAREFGYRILYPKRAKAVERVIRRGDAFIDADNFVWPDNIDPTEWAEFRPTPMGVDREFNAISPVELRNAANFIREQQPGLDRNLLELELLRIFGRRRRTQHILKHLQQALATQS